LSVDIFGQHCLQIKTAVCINNLASSVSFDFSWPLEFSNVIENNFRWPMAVLPVAEANVQNGDRFGG